MISSSLKRGGWVQSCRCWSHLGRPRNGEGCSWQRRPGAALNNPGQLAGGFIPSERPLLVPQGGSGNIGAAPPPTDTSSTATVISGRPRRSFRLPPRPAQSPPSAAARPPARQPQPLKFFPRAPAISALQPPAPAVLLPVGAAPTPPLAPRRVNCSRSCPTCKPYCTDANGCPIQGMEAGLRAAGGSLAGCQVLKMLVAHCSKNAGNKLPS